LCDTSLSLYHHCNPSQAYISDRIEQLDQWQLPFFFVLFFSFFFSPLLFVVCCFRSFSYLLSRWFLLRVDRAFTVTSSLKGSCSLKFRKIFKKVIKTVPQQLLYNFLFPGLGNTVHFTFNCLIKKTPLSLSLSLSLRTSSFSLSLCNTLPSLSLSLSLSLPHFDGYSLLTSPSHRIISATTHNNCLRASQTDLVTQQKLK